MTGSPITERRPPAFLARPLNGVMRRLVASRFGRRIKGLGMLEFVGRRSGRTIRVVVGVHDVDGTRCVFTPAPWRANFEGGRSVTLTHLGRAEALSGTLVTDPATVAAAIAVVLASGTKPAALALRTPERHVVSADDVVALDRAMIRLG